MGDSRADREPLETDTSIEGFFGEYRFLSNFFPSPVELFGLTFPTAEHAYVASKSLRHSVQVEIAAIPTPLDAKRYFDGRGGMIRPDWPDVRVTSMFKVLTRKFRSGSELSERLRRTTPKALIEANDWGDRYWGTVDGQGFNLLGKCLMLVRTGLLAAQSSDAHLLEPLQLAAQHHGISVELHCGRTGHWVVLDDLDQGREVFSGHLTKGDRVTISGLTVIDASLLLSRLCYFEKNGIRRLGHFGWHQTLRLGD